MKIKQCRSKCTLLEDLNCQGCSCHAEDHWAYNPAGWLIQWKSRKKCRGRFSIAGKHIPPGSKDYIGPEKMLKLHYIWGEKAGQK